jgi:type IV secretory pathway component VirB8
VKLLKSAEAVADEILEQNREADIDVEHQKEKNRVLGWRVAVIEGCALAVVTLALIAVAAYKQPPRTHLVAIHDNAHVEVIPDFDGDVSAAFNSTQLKAMVEQNLTAYAMACEGYYWGVFQQDNERCTAMSSDTVNKERAARFEAGNPESPLVKYSDGTTVRTEVLGKLPLDPDATPPTKWRIRMIKWTRLKGTGEEKPSTWEATAIVGYGKPPKKAEFRRHNPLGFIVSQWRVYPETQPSAVAQRLP